jgi:hypothetical protein
MAKDKIEFLTKLAGYRERLPTSIVPMLLAKNPTLNKSRTQNILKGITIDESLFKDLDELCEFLGV